MQSFSKSACQDLTCKDRGRSFTSPRYGGNYTAFQVQYYVKGKSLLLLRMFATLLLPQGGSNVKSLDGLVLLADQKQEQTRSKCTPYLSSFLDTDSCKSKDMSATSLT